MIAIPKYKLEPDDLDRIQKNPWLTKRERRIFELYYRDGVHIEDIAAEIERDRRTVDRILRKLRDVAKTS